MYSSILGHILHNTYRSMNLYYYIIPQWDMRLKLFIHISCMHVFYSPMLTRVDFYIGMKKKISFQYYTMGAFPQPFILFSFIYHDHSGIFR